MNTIANLIEQHWRSLTALMLLAITIGSLTPLDELPDMPGGDKSHHLIAYGLLAIPVAFHQPNRWWYFILGFAAWGGVIELVQPWANRYAEWLDLLANCVGLGLGIAVAVTARRFLSSQP